jgi:hypothetical protein
MNTFERRVLKSAKSLGIKASETAVHWSLFKTLVARGIAKPLGARGGFGRPVNVPSGMSVIFDYENKRYAGVPSALIANIRKVGNRKDPTSPKSPKTISTFKGFLRGLMVSLKNGLKGEDVPRAGAGGSLRRVLDFVTREIDSVGLQPASKASLQKVVSLLSRYTGDDAVIPANVAKNCYSVLSRISSSIKRYQLPAKAVARKADASSLASRFHRIATEWSYNSAKGKSNEKLWSDLQSLLPQVQVVARETKDKNAQLALRRLKTLLSRDKVSMVNNSTVAAPINIIGNILDSVA